MPQANSPNSTPGAPPPGGQPPPVLGDFELLDRIGEGGMGAVYKARQRSMERIVAVKVLKPLLARDKEYVERFWHEARAAARLSHPNIVLAINAGEDQGFYYFAMEYVDGHTVSLLLKPGPFDEPRALRIALQVAQALDYAWTHERIVHRDIKPGNIIITPDGIAKLADLGLAHEAELGEEGAPEETRILGTPPYISPEQIRRRGDLDVRCDLYSLGASLYHMVTGRAPFEGPDAKAIFTKHLFEPVPDPRQARPELSEGAARIIVRLMAKDREERYPSAQALVADLEAVLEGRVPGAPAEEPAPPAARPHRVLRRRGPIGIQFVALSLALAFLAFAALLFASSRGCGRRVVPPQPEPQGHGSENPAAAQAYDEALAYLTANPSDYVGAMRRLAGVESGFEGTAQAGLAAARRKQVAAELEEKGTEALDGLTRGAEALVGQGKYAEALALFARFPQGLAAEGWRERVARARTAAEKAARQRFEADLARGKDAFDKGQLDQALGVYQALGDGLLPAWRDEVLAKAEAVRQRQRELAERAKAEKEEAYRGLMGQLASLYGGREYDKAAQALRAALADEGGVHREELQRELDEIERVKAFWRAAEQGATALVGQPYSGVKGIKGELVSVRDGRLTVKTEGGLFTREIAGLGNKEIVRLALSVLPAGTGAGEAARFLIAQGDVLAAEERLKAVEAAGGNVADLRARLKLLVPGDPLAQKRAELDRAREALAAGKAQEAAAALRAFLERHKDQEGMADLRAEAKSLLDQATSPTPLPTATLPARLRIACDEGYKVYLNGKPCGTGACKEGAFDEVPLSVKPGDLLAIEATSKGAHRGLYALLDVQGGTYVVPTDSTWRWGADPPEGWQTDPTLDAKWSSASPAYWPHVKPGYGQAGKGLPGYWIWGRGERCGFRKLVSLQKTAAAQKAAEQVAERALTTKFGPPSKATLWLACRDSYLLTLNGRLAGCAASFLPQGASYELMVRQGDVLGVQATATAQGGLLDAKIDVENTTIPVWTDRSWVYTVGASPPEAWNVRDQPGGRWRAPEFLDDASHRVWGEGQALYFRKTLDLKRLDPARFRRLLYFYGQTKSLGDGRTEVTYDFRDPEQLADWHSDKPGDRPWVWTRGTVVGSAGVFYTMPYHATGLQVEAQVESASELVLGVWGEAADRLKGYTLTLSDLRRGGAAILRRDRATLAMANIPARSGPRRVALSTEAVRRWRDALSVTVDGREILSARDDDPIVPAELWRVGFRTTLGANTTLSHVRITARPDWVRLRADARRRGEAAGELPPEGEPGPPRPPRPGMRPDFPPDKGK